MSSSEAKEVYEKCPICCDELTLNNCSLLTCGHVYHFDCIQEMYESDWKRGTVSSCAVCRSKITCKPNRVYGNFPEKGMKYKILQPNINGIKMANPTAVTATIIDDSEDDYDDSEDDYEDDEEDSENDDRHAANIELLEQYQNRLNILERQIQNYSDISSALTTAQLGLRRTTSELATVRQKLDERNLKIQVLLKENFELTEERTAISLKLKAAKEELESFSEFKASIETKRLADSISSMQKSGYYKNLLTDPSNTKELIVGMLMGFATLNSEQEVKINENLRENRRLKIVNETLMKKNKQLQLELQQQQQRQQQQQMCQVLKPKSKSYDEASETELDEPTCIDDDKENVSTIEPFKNPFLVKSASNQNMMVPKTLPKGFSIPKRSSTAAAPTGTGKKQKVLQLPNGQNFFI